MRDLSSLILSHCGSRGHRSPTGGEAWFPDLSSIPFIIEEFVGLGVRWVLLDAPGDGGVVRLPRTLARSVKLLKTGDCGDRAGAFMAPIRAAMGYGPSERYTVVQQGSDIWALHGTTGSLTTWLEGQHNKSEISIALPVMREELSQLATACVGKPEARARLAILRGVFGGYRRSSTDALIVRPGAHAEFLDALDELLDDVAYHEFSSGTLELGWRTRSELARRRIARAVRAIIRRPAFRGMFALGRRAISTQTSGVDLLASEAGEGVRGDVYAPSIARIGPCLRRALTRWGQARPAFQALVAVPSTLGYLPEDAFAMEIGKSRLVLKWGLS